MSTWKICHCYLMKEFLFFVDTMADVLKTVYSVCDIMETIQDPANQKPCRTLRAAPPNRDLSYIAWVHMHPTHLRRCRLFFIAKHDLPFTFDDIPQKNNTHHCSSHSKKKTVSWKKTKKVKSLGVFFSSPFWFRTSAKLPLFIAK